VDVPRLLTAGGIATELDEPLHRVQHVLRTRRHLAPAARAGTLRLYRLDVIDAVRRELEVVDARRHRLAPVRLLRPDVARSRRGRSPAAPTGDRT
jgi:hypothetical protein